MFIETEQTPNPKSLKFIPDQPVLEKGTVHMTDAEAAAKSPLAAALFTFDQVAGVLLAPDFVSVTLKDEDWADMKPKILTAIMTHFTSGQPVLLEPVAAEEKASSADEGDPEIVIQIKTILEEKVRPAVAQDGGDIVFDRFEGGIVYLHMQGACAGCPSSVYTLKNGIENLLKYYIPEVTEVRPVDV